MNKRQAKKVSRLVGNYMLEVDSRVYDSSSEPYIVNYEVGKGRVNTSLIYFAQSMNRYLLNVEKSKGPYAHPSNYRHWKKGKRYNLKQHGM